MNMISARDRIWMAFLINKNGTRFTRTFHNVRVLNTYSVFRKDSLAGWMNKDKIENIVVAVVLAIGWMARTKDGKYRASNAKNQVIAYGWKSNIVNSIWHTHTHTLRLPFAST